MSHHKNLQQSASYSGQLNPAVGNSFDTPTGFHSLFVGHSRNNRTPLNAVQPLHSVYITLGSDSGIFTASFSRFTDSWFECDLSLTIGARTPDGCTRILRSDNLSIKIALTDWRDPLQCVLHPHSDLLAREVPDNTARWRDGDCIAREFVIRADREPAGRI